MGIFVRKFRAIGKGDVVIAGGKGASLGEMTQAGIPVPNGFVVLSDAFEKFIDETGLGVRIQAILDKVNVEEVHTIENASEEIKAIILTEKMPEDIGAEILNFFKKLGAKFVAVRSSATSEDSSSAAWAGQLDTFLNTSKKNLLDNVKRCWASLFTPRAIFYRFEQKLDKKQISVAVVVQKMIQSEESGIAFSVHPVTQDYNQIIIEAGLGLGEAIVSGQITPDSYVINKSDLKIVEIKVNEQEKGLFQSEEGGNEWRELGERGKKQVLSEKEIRELAEIIIKIENHYGFPCDIEWAREAGEFYITQSRPITTLTENKSNKELSYKSSDYIRMFETTRMPFLINTIALEHYKLLKAMSILKNNLWTTYLPKESEKKTLKEGIKLFGSESLFKEYQTEFESYKKRSIDFFDKLLKKNKPSRDEIEKYFSLIAELWKYYQKTEFFYVDEVYRTSKDNNQVVINLKKLEEIKNLGREHLNRLIFGSNSYLNKILFIISKQFSVSLDDLMFYSKEEIYNLFDNNKVEESILAQRKESYVFYSKDNKIEILQGNRALEFINNFLVEKGIKEIKGTSANKGKVIGKARVLFYGPETFDKIPEMIRDMKQGEILVTETTSPEIIAACKKASAILTNQGGLLSHAAIVSRELNIPCVVGLGNITHIVKDGDLIEVDAEKGEVRIIKKAGVKQEKIFTKEHSREYSLFRVASWYDSMTKGLTKILGEGVKEACAVYDGKDLVSIYYEPSELKKIFLAVSEKCKDVNKTKNEIKKYLSMFNELKQYYNGDKKIESLRELKEVYDFYYLAWAYTAFIFIIPTLNVNEELKKLALGARTKTQEYNEAPEILFKEVIERLLPKFINKTRFLLPEEIFLDNLKEKNFNHKILERENGFIYYGDKLYTGDLTENLKNFGIKLDNTNSVVSGKFQASASNLLGQGAYSGKFCGKVRIISSISDLSKVNLDDVLVASMTMPKYLPAMKKAGAFVTDEGGITCHAAIVARELKKPCVIGTKVATQVLHDGDLVEVDANQGVVRVIERAGGGKPNEGEITFLEKEFTREISPEIFQLWLKGYILACSEIGLPLEKPKKSFGIYENGVCTAFTQEDNISIFLNKLKTLGADRITIFLDEYESCYKNPSKDLEFCSSRFVIMFHLAEIGNQRAISLREKTQDFFAKLSKKVKLQQRSSCIVTQDSIKLTDSGFNLQKFLLEQKISINNYFGDKIKLIKQQSREHSLAYFYVWQKANQESSGDFFDKAKTLVFYNRGIGKRTDVYYGEQELQDIFDETGRRTAKDKLFFDKVKKEYYFYLNKTIPYIEGKKFAKSIEELKEIYSDWISWWVRMAIIFVLPESKTALESIANEALKIRSETEKYSDSGDRAFINLFKKIKPKLAEIAELMAPEEIFDCDKLDDSKIKIIKERAKGYTIFNGVLYSADDFSELLDKNNLMLPEIKSGESSILKGSIANPGKVSGKVRIISSKLQLNSFKEGEVLVAEMTSPDYVPIMKKAKAIITDEGGRMCHAAIVSREINKPCIVGTKIATQVLRDGDLVEVDADKGEIRVVEKAGVGTGEKKIFEELVQLNGPLGLGEIHYKKEAAENFPWANEKFEISPYIFYEKKGEAIYLYYDVKGIRWQIEQAGKYGDEKGAIKLIKKGYDKIKDIIVSEKALGRSEFLKFIKYVGEIWPWLSYMWWAIHYKEEKGESIENLMKIRKYTEYFTPGFIAVFRKSVAKIYPEKKQFADVILCSEILEDNIPSDEELKKRLGWKAFTKGEIFYSLEDLKKKYNLEVVNPLVNQELKGQTAYPGIVRGKVRIIQSRKDIADFKKGEIIVASTTTPDFLPAMKKSAAIISEHGGAICHASITSRELKIPCVVGVKGAIRVLRDGDLIEVDANQGVVRVLERAGEDTFVDRLEKGKFVLGNPDADSSFLTVEMTWDGVFRDSRIKEWVGMQTPESFINILKGRTMNMYIHKDKFKEFVDKCANIVLNNSKLLLKMRGGTISSAKNIRDFSDEVIKKIDKMSLSEIALTLKRAKEIQSNCATFGTIIAFADVFGELTNLSLKILQKRKGLKHSISTYSQLLTKPDEDSLTERAYKEIWEVGKMSNDLLKKFYWLNQGYIGRGLTENEFAAVLDEKKEENLIDQDSLLKELQLQSEEKRIFDIIKELVYLKSLRADSRQYLHVVINRLVDKLVSIWKIPAIQIESMYSEEIINILESKSEIPNNLENRKINSLGIPLGKNTEGYNFIMGEGVAKYLSEHLEIPKLKNDGIVKGQVAFHKNVVGRACLVFGPQHNYKIKEGDILISPSTSPQLIPAMKKAAAFVTDLGGVTSHAAIVAREMKKPCIVGTTYASQVFADGDIIEVDADKGEVRVLERAKIN